MAETKIRDWRLLKTRWSNTTNTNFDELLNCKLVKPPYDRWFDSEEYWVKKRNPYKTMFCDTAPVWWYFTDEIRLYPNGCTANDPEIFYMRKSSDWQLMRIYRKDGCDLEDVSNWEWFCTCPCWYDKFTPIRSFLWTWVLICNFIGEQVNWRKTYIYTRKEWGVWTTTIEDWLVGAEWDRDYTIAGEKYEERRVFIRDQDYFRTQCDPWTLASHQTSGSINIGDFIVTDQIVGGTAPTLANPNGYWAVVQIKTITWIDWSNILVDSPWEGFFVGNNGLQSVYQTVGTNVAYRIYQDRWDTFLITTCEWLRQWTWSIFVLVVRNGDPRFCWNNVNNNNWVISYQNKLWYINFWGVGTQQYLFNALNTINIGNPQSIVTFDQYTIWFWFDFMSIVSFWVSNTTGVFGRVSTTDYTRGIRSKDSYNVSLEWLKVITNDRRLVYLTIKPSSDWSRFSVLPEDKSEWIRDHLDKIQNGDEVAIYEDSNEMRIIITGQFRGGGFSTKTKMIIYDKNIGVWHTHESCAAVIKRRRFGEYLGEAIFTNDFLWVSDDDCDWGSPYNQRVSGTLITNTDSTGYQHKNLKEFHLLLGDESVMTDWLSSFRLDYFTSCYRPVFINTKPSWLCYLNMLKDIRNGDMVKPTKDSLTLLTECSNYFHECKGSSSFEWQSITDDCWFVTEKIHEDYCVCIDDRRYYLSPFTRVDVNLPYSQPEALWYQFSIEAKWADSIHMWWFVGEYTIGSTSSTETYCEQSRDCTDCGRKDCDCDKIQNEPWVWCTSCG